MSKNRGNEVLIAVIGLVGVLVTAVISNWDKISPPDNQLVTTYSGYRATGNFETELRYFFEVSGTRQTLEDTVEQILGQQRTNALIASPEYAEEINMAFDVIGQEAIRLDDVITVILPIYRKHFTVDEIQELNRFYSTEPMQDMLEKMPLVTADLAPLQVELIEEYLERVQRKLLEVTSG